MLDNRRKIMQRIAGIIAMVVSILTIIGVILAMVALMVLDSITGGLFGAIFGSFLGILILVELAVAIAVLVLGCKLITNPVKNGVYRKRTGITIALLVLATILVISLAMSFDTMAIIALLANIAMVVFCVLALVFKAPENTAPTQNVQSIPHQQ